MSQQEQQTTSSNLPVPQDDQAVSIEKQQEQQAEQISQALFSSEEQGEQAASLVQSFVQSYHDKPAEQPLRDWLDGEFRKYPQSWANEEERQADVEQVVSSVEAFNQSRASLQQHLEQGKSTANWLAGSIEKGAASSGSISVGQYAGNIDQAMQQANESALATITRQDGGINLGRNLDGFIAEQHHVDTFNIDAASKGSGYRAKVLTPKPGEGYGKNSMDIGIYDENGKLVRRYQSKYGADADATQQAFEQGDYRGQRKLVPEGQAQDISGSSETIEIDGVSSKPLSKADARERQRVAQEESKPQEYDWTDASRTDIAKQIGKQALLGACFASSLHGARILGRRIWNSLTGKENPPASEDMQEFLDSSLSSTGHAGTQVAVSGALVVISRRGLLGEVMKQTPAGHLANIACVAMENTKVLFKLATGQLSSAEALDALGSTNASTVVAIAGAFKGGAAGTAIGTVLGPAGMVVGGLLGGILGGMAGSKVGEGIYQASKSLAKVASQKARNLLESAGDAISSAFNSAKNFLTNLLPW